MNDASRPGRVIACAIGVMMLGTMSAGPACADELPPPPVVPGFENVVIGPRPLSGPAKPVPAKKVAKKAPTSTSTKSASKKASSSKTARKNVKKARAATVKKSTKNVRSVKRPVRR